jgi:hypothetical protein
MGARLCRPNSILWPGRLSALLNELPCNLFLQAHGARGTNPPIIIVSDAAFGGCGKSLNRCHSEERSDEKSLFLRVFNPRGIPRFARDDGVYAFFCNLFSGNFGLARFLKLAAAGVAMVLVPTQSRLGGRKPGVACGLGSPLRSRNGLGEGCYYLGHELVARPAWPISGLRRSLTMIAGFDAGRSACATGGDC